ncbi:hypothetical protein, partial [Xanthomonas phaseoli]|uniref:hypothetical protein n=1 Tax=Xanthomonas phaseoli TaxID=1985254 RepID=UPI001969FAD9
MAASSAVLCPRLPGDRTVAIRAARQTSIFGHADGQCRSSTGKSAVIQKLLLFCRGFTSPHR